MKNPEIAGVIRGKTPSAVILLCRAVNMTG